MMARTPLIGTAFTIAAVLAAGGPLTAQSTPVTLTVPFTLEKLHPDVSAVKAYCHVDIGTETVGSGHSPEIPVAQLQEANGKYSGTATVSFIAERDGIRPLQPFYRCWMLACLTAPDTLPGGQTCAAFQSSVTADPRLKVQPVVTSMTAFNW
ncbi:MAG TPA: hypothetical protein VMK65_00900 [Longimicrobiales bacterium]|nr:hypothetical protein [Longimicrobiales bacterium]